MSRVQSYLYSKEKNTKLSPHFIVGEFASKSGNKLYSDTVLIDHDLIDLLERLFSYLNCTRIVITSGYRTTAHDKAVGGDGKGYHTTGRATDVNCWHKVNGTEVRYHGSAICCALQDLGWTHGVGWIAGCAVHIDTRDKQYWFDEQNNCRSIGKDWYVYFAEKGYNVKKPRIIGDVDGDGAVTSTDARLVLQAAAGKIALDADVAKVADYDGDGEITSTDARLILQESAGKSS